jgi:hypothetical protein
MLTDEQCDEFRQMNCSFRDMIRAAYAAGKKEMRARAANAVPGGDICDPQTVADMIRAIPIDD